MSCTQFTQNRFFSLMGTSGIKYLIIFPLHIIINIYTVSCLIGKVCQKPASLIFSCSVQRQEKYFENII